MRHAEFFGPCGESQSLAVVGEKRVIALVSGLLVWCGPANIARFIVPIIVWVSIQAVLCAGPTTNVSEKVLERFTPPNADFNSASSVASEATIVRVVTPGDHSLPDFVLSGSRKTMLGMPCDIGRDSGTSATLPSILSRKFGRWDLSLVSAFAPAKPQYSTATFTSDCDYGQPSERKAKQIFGVVVQAQSGVARIGLSHDAFLDNVLWLEPRGVDSTVCGSLHSSLSGFRFNFLNAVALFGKLNDLPQQASFAQVVAESFANFINWRDSLEKRFDVFSHDKRLLGLGFLDCTSTEKRGAK